MKIGVLAWDHGELDDDSPVIAAIGRERGHDTSLFTVQEIDSRPAARGMEILFNGEPASDFDAVISRANLLGEWRDNVERLTLASKVPGLAMFDPVEVLVDSASKFRMAQVLVENDLPAPSIRACRTPADVELAAKEWGTIVIKPSYGRAGIDVERITDVADAQPLIHTLLERYHTIIAQPFYPTRWGEYRIIVVGETLQMGMVKYPAIGEWKTRTMLGASFERIEVPDDLAELAIKATRAMRITVSALDIVPTADGYVILEVQGIPGNMDILGKASQRRAHEATFEWVESHVE